MCFMQHKVQPLLKKSVKTLLDQQDSQGCWSFPAHLGSHYISLYALFLEWLRFRGFSSRLDLNRLAGILLKAQLPDGSWRQARDPALPSGDINATVLNYAALKFFRTSISTANVEPAIHSARKFILEAGGIDSVNQFTKDLPGAVRSAGMGGHLRNPLPDFPGGAAAELPAVLPMGHSSPDPHGLSAA